MEIKDNIITFILKLLYFNDYVELRHNCKHRKYKNIINLNGNERKVCSRCGEIFD
jgi:hypothetical protein